MRVYIAAATDVDDFIKTSMPYDEYCQLVNNVQNKAEQIGLPADPNDIIKDESIRNMVEQHGLYEASYEIVDFIVGNINSGEAWKLTDDYELKMTLMKWEEDCDWCMISTESLATDLNELLENGDDWDDNDWDNDEE